MRKVYSYLGAFLLLSFGLNAQNYTADEMLEIQAHQQSLVDLSISNPFQTTFSAPTFGTDSTMADWIPTAGATETFAPAVGDFFFDPGGPGGGPDEGTPGNYPNCGCATQTTLEGVSQIKIIDMDIFATFDYLRIYDGTDTSGTLLFGNGQGDPNDGDYSLPAGTILDAASGNFFFYFHASTVVNKLGWEIEIMEADGGGSTGPFPEPYCEVSGLSFVEPITRVIFSDIDNSSSVDSEISHEDFTSVIGNVEAGESYSFAVEGYTGGNFTNSIRVYIDWNQDGEFTGADEYYLIGELENSTGLDGQQVTATIEVPETALEGTTRMRVIKKFTASNPNPNDGCTGGSSFGQAEDYTLTVTNDGGAEPEPGDDCSQGIPSFADFPNAVNITIGNDFMNADDFIVDEGVLFTLNQITLDTNQQEVPDEVIIYIHEDDNGFPGAIIETINTVPDSSDQVGEAFGDPIYHLVFNLDTPIEFQEGRYWINSKMSTPSNEVVWLAVTDEASHELILRRSQDGGDTWTADASGYNAIMTVSGLCEDDDGSTEPGDDYDCTVEYEGSHDNALGNLQLLLYANDFVVANGVTMSVESLTVDIFADYTDATTLAIYENNGGQPGAVIESFSNVVPTSKTLVGSAFGFNIYESVFDFPTAVELEAGTYWIGLQVSTGSEGTSGYWATSDTFHGALPYYSNDGGTTWTQSTLGEDCAFIISGTCTGEAEPVDGCLWTVTVSDNNFGDEVEWEFRDQTTGNILLAGGGYGLGYNDSRTVVAEGPVEFYISTVGLFNDNTPSYSIQNENGVILSGVAPGGTTQTFSDMTCDDLPPPPPNLTCEDNFVASNNLENGIFLGGDTNQRLAVDVIVGDEGFTVFGMDLNIFTDGNTDLEFYFTIYEDDGGLPGAVFNNNGFGNVHSDEYIGNAFGYDVYNYVVQFETPVTLNANSTYWIEVESTGIAWEATEVNTLGSGLAFLNDSVSDWTDGGPDDLVYSLVCEDLGVADLSSFDFAYYPNPVKDVLNINSQKAVQSVEVYNLTGQKVINEAMVNQAQIDVSKLSAGTYVFRVTLEDGQVETFKIVKK